MWASTRAAARCIALLLGLMLATAASAQDIAVEEQRYVSDIELQTLEQFQGLLLRAEQLMLKGAVPQGGVPEVTFVLHGPVLNSLLRENYLQNRDVVDLAARLSAMDVIDLKACRTWMTSKRMNERDLQPFVETVAYGPGEVQRLVREKNYIYF
jgi:intracellular sulfur oxidation DsrE/DsrF family protein